MSTGSSAPILSQAFGDQQLRQILAAGTLARMQGGNSPEDLAKNFNSAFQQVTQSSVDTGQKLTPNTDRDLWEKMNDVVSEMGPNAGRFTKTVQELYYVNPRMANEVFDQVKDYYKNLSTNVSYEGEKGTEYKINENYAHAPDPFKGKIPDEYIPEAKGRLLDALTLKLIDDGYDYVMYGLEYLPNNLVGVKNTWGQTVATYPLDDIIQGEIDYFQHKEALTKDFTEGWGEDIVKFGRDWGKFIKEETIKRTPGGEEGLQSILDDLAKTFIKED